MGPGEGVRGREEHEMYSVVAVSFTDMVKTAGKSQIDYFKSLHDLVLTKKV